MSVSVTVAVTVEYRSNLYINIGGLYSECARDCCSDCRV